MCAEYRRVTDRYTDILPQHNPRYAYASRGNNNLSFMTVNYIKMYLSLSGRIGMCDRSVLLVAFAMNNQSYLSSNPRAVVDPQSSSLVKPLGAIVFTDKVTPSRAIGKRKQTHSPTSLHQLGTELIRQ